MASTGHILAPRRRNFNLRTDASAAITTAAPEPIPEAKKVSKRSRLSRLFSKRLALQTATHAPQQHLPIQRSLLFNLPDTVLNRILFFALELPQKISLNFPYSPLPDGCTLHLASTPTPPIFLTCKSLQRACQIIVLKHATFNITLLSGGPTAHFWLHHDWAGNLTGPKRCIQNVLRRAEKIEIVVAAPTVNTNIDTSTGELHSLVRRGFEKEEWDAIRKCLAICVAYIQGRKLGKGAIRELGKQIENQDKTGSLSGLQIGEKDEGCERDALAALRVILSRRDPSAFITNETSQILETLQDIQVDGKVEVELRCGETLEKERMQIERSTATTENALTKDWPNREEVVACK
ncbi:hypothetical protein N0V90_010380 [Kalmusia sp. IMI 367209]|nr:hypothetical protein N0V90_010380 [Kalmusia sp. IMI 367209]